MSLIGALNTARTALSVQQAAIQTTGNNIANAGDANYSREVASLTPSPDQEIAPGQFVGTGVDLTSIKRQVDDALQSRLNSSVSDNSAASTTQDWLTRVQSTFNELGSEDLSTGMSTFFSGWSDLANNPQDTGLRQVVLQNGDSLAGKFQNLRSQLSSLQGNVDDTLKAQTAEADSLTSQIAVLNGQISTSEGGTGGEASGLRDQRDGLIKQLSQLMDVKTVQQPNGVTNVYVGSEPLVYGTQSSGVALQQKNTNGVVTSTVVFKSNNETIPMSSGSISGLLSSRSEIAGVVKQVDGLAHNLIFALNKLHASGQGTSGFTTVTSTNAVTDATAALNTAASGLTFTPNNGSFVVHVTDTATGQSTSTLVQVPLTGGAGDATLNSLTASLNGVSGVTASISGGKLTVGAAGAGTQISFSQDSSGALAALGINSFFTGTDASDIAVNSTVEKDPSLISAAKNGDSGDNQTALAIAALETQPNTALNGMSIQDTYQGIVNGVSNKTAAATTDAKAAQNVQDTLQSQRDSLSGVSMDEEAINLMQQQRAFQGAARVINVVNEMLQTVINLVQ